MKLIFTTFALIAFVSADVSHLSRQYLPAVEYSAGYVSGKSKGDYSRSVGLLEVNFDTDSNDKLSDAESSSGQEHNFEYAQKAEQVPVSGAVEFIYVNADKQSFEPGAPLDFVSYGTYSKVAPIEEEDTASYGKYSKAAPLEEEVNAVSYSKAHLQYQPSAADANQQQHHMAASFSAADIGHAGVIDDAAGVSYGSYDFGNQETGAHDLGLSSYTNSYDHSAALGEAAVEGQSAWHGSVSYPAQTHNAVAHYVSSGSTGRFKTNYGANGGYIY